MREPLQPATFDEILGWERRYDGPLPQHLRDAFAGAGPCQALAAGRALDRLARHQLMQIAARRRASGDLAALTPMVRRMALVRRVGLALRQGAS